ncbi:hypothetical protein IQ225_07005 [Synechocystis salina LEGE 06155]|nr:hypothetical protein [Synechocystis salina LEGE 06155]
MTIELIEPKTLRTIIRSIEKAKRQICWKPNKANPHLLKRIRLNHLPASSDLKDYENLIQSILANPEAQVYIYTYDIDLYPKLTAYNQNRLWLLMLTAEGIVETAFPPSNPSNYLSNPAFTYLGKLGELLS